MTATVCVLRQFVLLLASSTAVLVAAQQSAVQSCSPCAEEGMTFQNSFQVLIPGQGFGSSVLCGFLQTWFDTNGFTDDQCQTMRDAGIDQTCECGYPEVAVAANGDDNTISRSNEFYLHLVPVTGVYGSKAAVGLTEACAALFQEHLSSEDNPVVAECSVGRVRQSYYAVEPPSRRQRLLQRLTTTPTDNHHHYRALQSENDANTLDVILRVFVQGTDRDALYKSDLLDVWEDNESDFLTNLKNKTGEEESQLFFGSVETVEVEEGDSIPVLFASASEGESADSGDEGLSGGAKAGIIIAVVVAVLLAP